MTPAERGDFVLDRMRRELRLFEKYGITDLRGLNPDSPYRKLALALAKRYESDFKPRDRGRPKKHRDDCELVLMVELVRRRDNLSVPCACKTIAEKGAPPGSPNSLYERHKFLMKQRPWRVLLQGFEQITGALYVEMLEETIGAKLK